MKSNEEYQDDKIWTNFSYVIQIIQSYVKQNNIKMGFRPDQEQYAFAADEPDFTTQIANLHGEVSEAWEAWRQWGLDDVTGQPLFVKIDPNEAIPKPEGVGSEFADILIRLLDSADICGIDLAKEVRRKMQYNATRSYRHGGNNA